MRSGGKSALIKSISECIQSSNARSLSSCILRRSAARSRRPLSIAPKWRAVLHDADKNERKGDNAGGGRCGPRRRKERSGQQRCRRRLPAGLCRKTQAPPGRPGTQIPKSSIHPKQPVRVDLTDAEATAVAVQQADPDLVLHLAAESDGTGTFHLLQGGTRALGGATHRAPGGLPLPSHLHRGSVWLPGHHRPLLRNHPLRPAQPLFGQQSRW